MSFSYDLTTAVGKTRALIPDTAGVAPDEGHEDAANQRIFEDAEITNFLAAESGVPRLAAALALETAARNQALRLKVARILDIQVDGARLLEALLTAAKALRQQSPAADGAGSLGIFFAALGSSEIA